MERRPHVVIDRPRVSALLDSLAEQRLVCVVGDAASGRSTAVRHWLEQRGVAAAWPALANDRPREMLAAFAEATEPFCPGLTNALAPELDAARATPDDPIEQAGVLAGALAAAWADLSTGPFVVVVDDLDGIRDPAGLAFLATLVRLYPRRVRMIVLGSSAPPFAVHRLDAAGQYGELGPRDLRFDADETAALFAAAGMRLDQEQAAAVTDACGGWAGGLRLAVDVALGSGVEELAERLAVSGAPALLADLALRPLDEVALRTIRALAVLGHVERAAVATRPDSIERLDALAERGLLVRRDEAGWTLTTLARYAVDTAVPPDGVITSEVLADCVAMAVEAGAVTAALRWAATHADPTLVRRTLHDVGRILIDSADPVIGLAADRLPVPVGDVEVDGLLASWFASRGDLPRALTHLGGARPTDDEPEPLPVPIGRRVASALWLHGDAALAQAVLDRTVGDASAAEQAHLAATRATLAWGRGDGADARTHADDALRLARASQDDGALAVAWVNQALVAALEGDLARNQRCYSTALSHAVAAHDVPTRLRVHCNVGSRLTEIGRYREAVVELDEAVRLGEATGQRTRIALARLNQAQARLGLGLLDEALQDAETALEMWGAIDSPMVAYAQQLRGDVLARRGDRSRAVRAYRAAIEAAEAQRDAQTLAPAAAGLARCLVADDADEAQRVADRALAEPVALGSLAAMLARGWVALHTGDTRTAITFARSARTEAARRDDPAALAQAIVLDVLASDSPAAGPRLSEARALLEEIGDAVALAELDAVDAHLEGNRGALAAARARLRALGVRDSAALVAGPLAVLAERRRGAVTICTLGSFAVEVDGAVVPVSAWQSRKARDLVKILAARRGRAIPRDGLAELLWPGSTGDKIGNRLSVALSTARAVFDPDKALPADHVLVADRDAVRLDLRTVVLDVDEFIAQADAALAAVAAGAPEAIALLESAAAAYGGDFCEEDPYEEWAEQPRTELRARQQQILSTLADTLTRSGRPDDAVPRLITLLALDRYDERTHLRLVATLVRSGRHGEARRAYRAYADRMAEIDIEPATFPQPSRRVT